MLSNGRDISLRLQQSFDPLYYQGLYEELCYAYGSELGSDIQTVAGRVPIYPDIRAQWVESGSTRKILTTSYMAVSRYISSEPCPSDFEGLDPILTQVRQEFWRSRYRGDLDSTGHWSREVADTWHEGDVLGVGCIRVGLTTDRRSGLQKVTVRHSPILQTLWDCHEKNPYRSKYVAFATLMSPEEASAIYGEQRVKPFIQTLGNYGTGTGYQVVRIWEYFDVGIGRCKPTKATFIGDISGDPIKVEPNPFGILPCSWYINFLPDHCKRPIGRIAMQRPSQDAINDVMHYLRKNFQSGQGIDIVDTNSLSEEGLEQWRSGDPDAIIETDKALDTPPILRVPGRAVPQGVLEYLAEVTKEFNSTSNFSELDRGALLNSKRTATEIATLQNALNLNTSLTTKNTLEYLETLMRVVYEIAKQWDRAPVTVKIDGRSLKLNDPSEPISQLHKYLEQEARIVLSSDVVTAEDDRLKRMEAQQTLMQLLPLVGQSIDPEWFVRQLLEAAGVKDIDAAIQQTQQGQTVGQMPGQEQMQAPLPGSTTNPLLQQQSGYQAA
ncbi:MAG: hypothetical protein JSS66_00150 [Armatimonadetes bacterium]|nr:hypothetical protein [Armatimonadota bacterium]